MHVSCRPSVPPIQHSTDVQSLVAGPNPTRQPDLDKQPRNIRNLAFPFTARHSNLFSSTILKDFRFVNNNFNFVADLVVTLVLIVYSAIAYHPTLIRPHPPPYRSYRAIQWQQIPRRLCNNNQV
jgi:hypothetical protein